MQRILNQTEIYSGIYARVSVRFFPYASNGKNGIGCGLGPVHKIEDGEPMGGRVTAAAAFGDNGGDFSPIQVQTLLSTQQSTAYPQQIVYNSQMPGCGQNPMNTQRSLQIDPITGAPVNGGVMGI